LAQRYVPRNRSDVSPSKSQRKEYRRYGRSEPPYFPPTTQKLRRGFNQGSGIGRATAIAYAQAEAKSIALLGRTESTLRETECLVRAANAALQIDVFVASVADEAVMKRVAEKIGAWDVLVLNAGYITAPVKIVDVSIDDFWTAYEVRRSTFSG
jgi:hypothetical protein